MTELLTQAELETSITLNNNRLNESRDKGEPVLAKLFEQRLNSSLDIYSDFLRFTIEVAGV